MEVISHAVDNTSILYIAACYMHMQHGITVLCSTSRQNIRAVLLYGILGMRNVKMKMKRLSSPQALHDVVGIQILGMLDCFEGFGGWKKVINSNFLVLIFLVILKEATDLSQTMGW